jgi:hypothetical protein
MISVFNQALTEIDIHHNTQTYMKEREREREHALCILRLEKTKYAMNTKWPMNSLLYNCVLVDYQQTITSISMPLVLNSWPFGASIFSLL